MITDVSRASQVTIDRLWSRINQYLPAEQTEIFRTRLETHLPTVLSMLHDLYGHHFDFFYHLEQILITTAKAFSERADHLKAIDAEREGNFNWFQDHKMVGGVIYVDLFAGDLQGISDNIDYFKELGITYLHLMPFFKSPESNNDGGYAISSYRDVDPDLGTIEQLRTLAKTLNEEGISLVADFVFNHTSNEHEWAKRALAGEEHYQNLYYMFPDRTLPDQYNKNLRLIFPEHSQDNFLYLSGIDKYVWSTFYKFQWDLNYTNPETFNAMLGEMLFLANVGIDILRLDAVPFIWKQLGTNCENLPQVHKVIRAYNALVKIAAPAMLFKSEAIVHPDDVASYVAWKEAPLSYNPTMMATLWDALATREVHLLHQSMSYRFQLPEHCAWINYIRVHDDIGWSFADEDANHIGINGYDHRQFLNAFYTGKHPGSFATGLGFGYNPVTNDLRICGTTASLCGLEQALASGEQHLIDDAIKRILMLHSIILSAGGIPLIYIGDEIATINDYSYRSDPDKANDNRWVHRPFFDWERAEKRHEKGTVENIVYTSLKKLIDVRKSTPSFTNGQTIFINSFNKHILTYICNRRVLVLVNFSEFAQTIHLDVIRPYHELEPSLTNLVTGSEVKLNETIELAPYQFMWLKDLSTP